MAGSDSKKMEAATTCRDQEALMAEEYLTIAEVAARLKIKPKTIKNNPTDAARLWAALRVFLAEHNRQ